MPPLGHSGIMPLDFRDFANSYIDSLVGALVEMPFGPLEEFWELVEKCRKDGKTVHFIGNGGSAATPSHSAGDWSKELSLRTISHVDNISSFTAWANDTEYQNVFVGQLSTFISEGDIVVAFSGSGNSQNVLNGVEFANESKCKTVAITGNYRGMGGGRLAEICDVSIVVPSESMERIEDIQLIINHIIKEAIKSNNGL